MQNVEMNKTREKPATKALYGLTWNKTHPHQRKQKKTFQSVIQIISLYDDHISAIRWRPMTTILKYCCHKNKQIRLCDMSRGNHKDQNRNQRNMELEYSTKTGK